MIQPRSTTPAWTRDRLFLDFADYYAAERCDHAPKDPRRVYRLAHAIRRKGYRDLLSREELLDYVYRVLGFHGEPRPRLFARYSMSKYGGRKSAEDHFVNLFARKLRGLLYNAHFRDRRAVRVLACDPSCLRGRPGLRPGSSTQSRLAFLPVALHRLTRREWDVVRLRYWNDLSDRAIGRALGRDHKTVARAHASALRKLREAYELKDCSRNVRNRSPFGRFGGD